MTPELQTPQMALLCPEVWRDGHTTPEVSIHSGRQDLT